MNRRGFLGTLAGLAAGFALDPELALWKAGERKIFIPSLVKPDNTSIWLVAWNNDYTALIEKMSRNMAETFFYGHANLESSQFAGMAK